MPLTAEEWELLQAALRGLKAQYFSGVLVGYGSMILHFSDGPSLLMQCPFEVFDNATSSEGHGETSGTAVILFGLLNEDIVDVSLDANCRITLTFTAGRGIRIIPDGRGFESYVLTTSSGVFPVIGAVSSTPRSS